MSADSPDAPRARAAWRLLVLVGVSAYLLAGVLVGRAPVRGGDEGRWLPAWLMFSGASKGVTQVRFVRSDPAGRRAEIDRFEVLGLDELDQPPGVWLVRGTARARKLGRRLCGALGPEVTMRLISRTATAQGWREEPETAIVCRNRRTRSGS